ncbi:MAG: hypothetical protein AAF078_09615 [Planctomycetota bacterium]
MNRSVAKFAARPQCAIAASTRPANRFVTSRSSSGSGLSCDARLCSVQITFTPSSRSARTCHRNRAAVRRVSSAVARTICFSTHCTCATCGRNDRSSSSPIDFDALNPRASYPRSLSSSIRRVVYGLLV